MLLSFRFANHRSFRDEQQLNLLPAYEADDRPDDKTGLEAVPVAGIFGANASGKSNVISAFSYLRTMVQSSDRNSEPGIGPVRYPFRLDPEITKEPSSYAIDLLLGGVRHTYGFTVDDKRITEEWLYSFPHKRKRVVFDRTGQSFEWGDESKKSRIRRLEEIVAPTALFLSVAARFEPHDPETGEGDATSSSLHGLYYWLRQDVTQVGPSSHDPFSRDSDYSRLLDTAENRSAIVELLHAADVGIEEVFLSEQQDDSNATSDLGKLLTDLIIRRQPRQDQEPTQESAKRAIDEDVFAMARNFWPRRVMFRHRGTVGSITLGVQDESSGTLRLLELSGNAIPVLGTGGLLLVDEIDSSLHPLLTAALVRLFQSPTSNPMKAQLVFTTHDATLLGSIDGDDVLQRDQAMPLSLS
jgi:uncharacterized protein